MNTCAFSGCPAIIVGGFQGFAPIASEFSENPPQPAPKPIYWCETHKEHYLALNLGEGRYLTEHEIDIL
jgi:hypothetical protein